MSTKTKLEYDNDGNPVFDTSLIDAHAAELQERVNYLERALYQVVAAQNAQAGQQSKTDVILNKDPRYPRAYNKLKDAYDFIEQKIIDMELNYQVLPSEALDLLEGTDAEVEFSKKFPELTMEDVVGADNSHKQFQKVLDNLANRMPDPNEDRSLNVFNEYRTPVKLGFGDVSDKAAEKLEELLKEHDDRDIPKRRHSVL